MHKLHPDKLVGVARAVQQRPTKPKRSVESAAVAAASKPRRLTPPKEGENTSELLQALAFQLRDAHWDGHLERMARRVDSAVKPKRTGVKRVAAPNPSGQPQAITIHLGQGAPKVS